MSDLSTIRRTIRDHHIAAEADVIGKLSSHFAPPQATREKIASRATKLVETIRADDEPGLMEVFLAEYGLSTDEGVALMCLAEALLRVPDDETIDDLIEDKIAPSSWGAHLGKSSSSLVNASTWALLLTGKVLDEGRSSGVAGVLHGAIKRLGEPVIRTAVKRAMQVMGSQFVLGEIIASALSRGMAMEKKGYAYSYDMLGEAALTARDADGFFEAYKDAIMQLSAHATAADIRNNPGISIKLSALHPRYEVPQKARVMGELVDRVLALTLMAKKANMGLNIDAEEADRLDLSLDVIEAVLTDERVAGWDGFGVVVQAYSKRAAPVLDWLYTLAKDHDRRIMVRLVKGAYWDSEIKRAQVEGIAGFPVFTDKAATDISYICCAQKLLAMTDVIYPQFATHNAHSVAAVLEMAEDLDTFEFQRLHGMGETLHRIVKRDHGTRCRIYAPVGAHRDLLAYLVRRLLENGANSSFVNQIVDESVPAAEVAADPFGQWGGEGANAVCLPPDLFQPERQNSEGFDLHAHADLERIEEAREPFRTHLWHAEPLLAVPFEGAEAQPVFNPADRDEQVGTLINATPADVEAALAAAHPWDRASATERAAVLNRAANLYEEYFGEFFAVLSREAGKTLMDAVAELREAVDFLRCYASQVDGNELIAPRGTFGCISPWNFPLAIFTGQIAAALAAGNSVLAKPAEPAPLTASIAVRLLHEAGVPRTALQFLPGEGASVGSQIVGDGRINGVCFTGSTATAQRINRAMAENVEPAAPLIAETGGLNAMIVDSTALPEQAIADIVASAFQSAGQRCSALRVLYVQEDVAETFRTMLFGAMDELRLGNPWKLATDIGPVINEAARNGIVTHIDAARDDGRLLKQIDAPEGGIFVGPAVIEVAGIEDLEREIFGPVLHLATFKAGEIDDVVDAINASGYGLTFGLHTRIDDRVESITNRLNVGNMYINRNQIGAIVGSQPFGGEGLSGTGPKAGGPHYVPRFCAIADDERSVAPKGTAVGLDVAQRALAALPKPERLALEALDLPGPTGESNRLSIFPRGTILCLGPTAEDALAQVEIARSKGCKTLAIAPGLSTSEGLDGTLERKALDTLTGFDVVVVWSDEADQCAGRQALAARDGALIPLVTERDFAQRCILERHICVDTTAAGGNAALLAEMA